MVLARPLCNPLASIPHGQSAGALREPTFGRRIALPCSKGVANEIVGGVFWFHSLDRLLARPIRHGSSSLETVRDARHP